MPTARRATSKRCSALFRSLHHGHERHGARQAAPSSARDAETLINSDDDYEAIEAFVAERFGVEFGTVRPDYLAMGGYPVPMIEN